MRLNFNKMTSLAPFVNKKKGSIIPIVLGIIVVVSVLGIAMLQSMKQRRQSRHDYEELLLVDYVAQAGIQKAYHLLLASDWESRFYLSGANELKGKLESGMYEVTVEDDSTRGMSVKITSTGYIGKKKKTIIASARYFSKEEIVAENYLVRKILHQSLWQLTYQ